MPTPNPLITEPWSDYSYSAQRAVIVKEVSGEGISSGPQAIAAVGIFKGSLHREDQRLVCDDPVAVMLAPRNFWRITYGYAPLSENHDQNQLREPPRYRWRIGLKSEPEDRDIDKNPIVNSAFDPFDNIPPNDFPEGFLTITRFETAPFDFQNRIQYVGRVNDGDMTIQGHSIKDGQMKCLGISPTGEYTMLDTIIEVAYDFQLDEDGFDLEILDQGLRGWRSDSSAPGGKVRTEIYHKPDATNGETTTVQISGPVLLNGKGKPLIDTLVTRKNQKLVGNPQNSLPRGAELVSGVSAGVDGLTPVYMRYKRKRRVNFTQLGL